MADKDDPFYTPDEDRTIIKPNPGGRRQQQRQPSAPPPESGAAQGGRIDLSGRSGLNPLESAAAILLNLLSQVRNTSSHPNPSALHQQLANEVGQFERKAQAAGIPAETIYIARYALCSTIDEFVMSTPWGQGSVWSRQSLLSLFHKETQGGEKFFKLLKKLLQNPAQNIDLLELMYLCLALGFQGRYRVSNDGLNELERIRENLYHVIRQHRGEFETGLSPHWEGVERAVERRKPPVPLWMVASVVLLLLVAIFTGWRWDLSRRADPVQAQLVSVGREDALRPTRVLAEAAPVTIPDPEPARFGLREFLAPEIAEGLVEVDELPDRIEVRIPGDGLFASGSDQVKSDYERLMARIGEGLTYTSGRVRVIGHTDNVPLRRGGRFASNFELSQARAESVVDLLAVHLDSAGRLVPEGLGDTQPLAANDTAEGRSRNRRVEIVVMEAARS